MPCKHLAAVCYVLAEEFDRDPFAMLAWRGKGRDELLAALRQLQARGAARLGPGAGGPTRAGCAAAGVRTAPAAPLAECLDGVLVRPG